MAEFKDLFELFSHDQFWRPKKLSGFMYQACGSGRVFEDSSDGISE